MKIIIFVGLVIALISYLGSVNNTPIVQTDNKTKMQSILDQYSDTTFYPYGFTEALLEYEQELLKDSK